MLPLKRTLSREEIAAVVWRGCDTLRGAVDPTQYKDYVLTMLFVKYLSDVWKDKVEYHREKYQGDNERIERALRRERFYVPEECTFDYLFQNRNDDNIGNLIDIALMGLEDANRTKLERVFRAVSFNSEAQLGPAIERNRRLKNLLLDFSALDLQPSHLQNADVIGDAYEYLIGEFAGKAGKKAGEFYTPAEVSELLAKLVAPRPGDRICDPTCGSGSLLIKVAAQVGSNNFSLYGQENNGSTWALCRMNMFLHGMDSARIEWGDTLNNPKLIENDTLMRFNVVVANPPFSLDKWGAEKAHGDPFNRYHRGIPPKSKADFAFISHMIETTYPTDGRVGVIVPNGVLFRGSSEGTIRQQLVEENLLEAVIGLPANLFYGTGIPAAILLFNRTKGQNKDVLFVDASREFENGKNQNRLNTDATLHILETVQRFRTSAPNATSQGQVVEDKYAYRATLEEIKSNDFNLNLPRYVDTFEEEEAVDMTATKAKIQQIRQALADTERQMEKYLTDLGF
ncbi:type I restriction enzyme M protein [Runella defluvii]|uniref:site-specific DNA-methyltransferase (adenine-specific) n=1 Tax=Runella defluvii TaxID=370973 RepID=A0A7W5ZNM8_9BACT|nr:type I restriction-modification system subunit M [Runella defluvii]MBB3840279.1 type I restriction enzyme M protein [Runella defluvii]